MVNWFYAFHPYIYTSSVYRNQIENCGHFFVPSGKTWYFFPWWLELPSGKMFWWFSTIVVVDRANFFAGLNINGPLHQWQSIRKDKKKEQCSLWHPTKGRFHSKWREEVPTSLALALDDRNWVVNVLDNLQRSFITLHTC